ncbi:MAG: succinyldiaminopimelate transaminase [Nitrosomonadaceae bacterium]|nr:succinyldiaminopimelate transaminase [Nitrosomonadaceae bacterium]
MNPNLNKLYSYPFQKLNKLYSGIVPNPAYAPISLHIGEPKHKTPDFIRVGLIEGLDKLTVYPTTLGEKSLRISIASWLKNRYKLPAIDPDTEVIPVNGSREALFSFAQAVIDPSHSNATVICPNPFYQIYEGAALLAGATPYFLNALPENDFIPDYSQIPNSIWARTQLIYVCSPANPTGTVMTIDEWKELFTLADHYGFVIAADECYSEIYLEEHNPPLGALEAAHLLNRKNFSRLIVFGSLSKRSNVPGMRSGFVVGNSEILKKFLLYRTYHGCAMNPAVQAASIAAWGDESHVSDNRRLYREKFIAVHKLLNEQMEISIPQATFYFWARTVINDTDFSQRLYQDYNVTVLPGSYLSREVDNVNPGKNFIRMAMVPPLSECIEATKRIKSFCTSISK